MTGLFAKKTSRWDEAVADLNDLYARLDVTEVPAARAVLYDRIAAANEKAARAVDLNVMPPLDPDEGKSYAQVYADSARMCRILADGERSYGLRRRHARLPGVHPSHLPLWQRYLTSADRAERADLLYSLYGATEAAIGYGAASVLNLACLSERKLARSR